MLPEDNHSADEIFEENGGKPDSFEAVVEPVFNASTDANASKNKNSLLNIGFAAAAGGYAGMQLFKSMKLFDKLDLLTNTSNALKSIGSLVGQTYDPLKLHPLMGPTFDLMWEANKANNEIIPSVFNASGTVGGAFAGLATYGIGRFIYNKISKPKQPGIVPQENILGNAKNYQINTMLNFGKVAAAAYMGSMIMSQVQPVQLYQEMAAADQRLHPVKNIVVKQDKPSPLTNSFTMNKKAMGLNDLHLFDFLSKPAGPKNSPP